MGSEMFNCISKGKDAIEAFERAVEDAYYWHGHAGYTGTIAEKESFVVIDLPEGMSPSEFEEQLIDDQDERIDDKWGPAGCIEIPEGDWEDDVETQRAILKLKPNGEEKLFSFFGWASC